MRSDYSLYVVAVICFIIAGVFVAGTVGDMSLAATAIFLILGILFATAGYAMRPKAGPPTPKAPPPLPAEPSPLPSPPPVEEKEEEAPVAPPAPLPQTEEPVPSIPPTPPPAEEAVPTPALEEPAKVEEEKLTEKPVRRRRRKKAA